MIECRAQYLAVTAIALTMGWPGVASAQSNVALGPRTGVISESFSLLRGARELADGHLIVTDWIEQRIALVDFGRDAVADRGRVGGGPSEFRLPGALFPWRGDSTLLVDVGNTRLSVLDRDGRITRAFRPSSGAGAASPGGTDTRGGIYHVVPAWSRRPPLPNDSVELVLWDPVTGTARTIANVQGSTRPPPGSPDLGPRVPFVVFARQDGWTVTPTGRVAIVRGHDYGIDWIDGDRRSMGPSHATAMGPVTAADRTAFVRRFVAGSAMSGRGEGGGLGHVPADQLTDDAVARMVRASAFAESLPFFRPGAVFADAAGRIWVGRWTRDGEPARFDVFDEAGRRIQTVALPMERELLLLGARSIYLVRTDNDGLQTLERYALPGLR